MNTQIIVQILMILMIIGFSIHATYTDLKRFEIENYAVLFGTPILLIATFFMDKKVLSFTTAPMRLVSKELNILTAIISFIVIFVFFLAVPVGGGDMKFLAFLAAFFGVVETFGIFLLGTIIVLLYHLITARSHIKNNPDTFEGLSKSEQRKILIRRQVPLVVGIGPAVIIASIYQILQII